MVDGVVVIEVGDVPLTTAKRKLLRTNHGLYCSNEQCREFIAFAVDEEQRGRPLVIEVRSDPPDTPILVECPFCQERQGRMPLDFESRRLTEPTKQRPLRN